MNKLLIISHTEHYIDNKGIVVGWGSTVTELDYLATIFDEVIHLAPLHKETAPKSAIHYKNNIKYIPLKPSGGKGLKKLNIFFNAPHNLAIVNKYCNEVDIIQFRAPTGIGMYMLPFLKYFNKKPYWVKYAGNWVAKELPFANNLQRWWLKNLISLETKVTINGNWLQESKNIMAFENPCLTKEDRVNGAVIIKNKELTEPYNYCFVGGLNENKGIEKAIQAFKNLAHDKLGSLHIVGDGDLRTVLENEIIGSNYDIQFHGFLPKNKILKIFKKCHFVLLPSKSEGFPKVIGEAMNYGCVPIVSEVSCINQYIQNNYNGFLINPISVESVKNMIEKSLKLSNNEYKSFTRINYKLAEKFTYENYLKRIQKEIIS